MHKIILRILIFATLFQLSEINSVCFCQNIKGKVINSATMQAIPYVIVYSKKDLRSSTLSDSSGFYRIKVGIPEDTLVFEALGYYSKKIIVKNLKCDSLIILNQKNFEIGQVEIKAKKKKTKNVRLGYQKNSFPSKYMLSPGSQIAVFFSNDKHYNALISKVGYFIKESGFPNANFRVRIYDNDANFNAPLHDLLDTNLIVHGAKGEEWVVVDVKKYSIKMPYNGYFVAMEWLPSSSELDYYPSNLPGYTGYGQVLGGTNELKKFPVNTWTKNFPYRWLKADQSNMLNTMNAAINSEIIVLHENSNDIINIRKDSSAYYVFSNDYIRQKLGEVDLDTSRFQQSTIALLFKSLLKCLEEHNYKYLFAYLVYHENDDFNKSIMKIIEKNKKKEILTEKQRAELYNDLKNMDTSLDKAIITLNNEIYDVSIGKYIISLIKINNGWRANLNYFIKN
jgi:hypothetical protein